MAAGGFKDMAIFRQHLGNPRAHPAHDVIHQPRRRAVRAQALPRGPVNQRALVKMGECFRTHQAAVAETLDLLRRLLQRRAPHTSANHDRLRVLTVVVFRQAFIDVLQIRECQPDEAWHFLVLKNLRREQPERRLQEPPALAFRNLRPAEALPSRIHDTFNHLAQFFSGLGLDNGKQARIHEVNLVIALQSRPCLRTVNGVRGQFRSVLTEEAGHFRRRERAEKMRTVSALFPDLITPRQASEHQWRAERAGPRNIHRRKLRPHQSHYCRCSGIQGPSGEGQQPAPVCAVREAHARAQPVLGKTDAPQALMHGAKFFWQREHSLLLASDCRRCNGNSTQIHAGGSKHCVDREKR